MSSEEIYVALAARFWERQKQSPFKPVDVALYMHLLDTCYSLNWKTPFFHGNDYICKVLGGVDTKTLIASRERLMNGGEVGFVSGKHRKDLSEYSLLDLANLDRNKGGIFPPLPDNKAGKIPVVLNGMDGNIPPLTNNKAGNSPPLFDGKTAPANKSGGKGGKTPHNGERDSNRTIEGEQKNTNTPESDPLAFEVFWGLYGKKVDRKKSERIWIGLPAEKKTKALARIPAYVRSTPNPKFRKDPLTYLHGENWDDEDLPPADNKPTPAANQTTAPLSQAAKLKQQADYIAL